MSAIGQGYVFSRSNLDICVKSAIGVSETTTGFWIWKRKVMLGLDEFNAKWAECAKEQFDFDYSGWAFNDLSLVYYEIDNCEFHDTAVSDEDVAELHKIFTFAHPITKKKMASMPQLTDEMILKYCREDHPDDIDDMFEAIRSADDFLRKGTKKLQEDDLFVLVLH